MRTLLDTQILIWSLIEPDRIEKRIKSLVDRQDNSIFVSCISIFEIEQKKQLGKLKFDYEFKTMIDDGAFEILDLKFEHVNQIKTLPLIHRDPFDRLIIAQSMVENMPLITSDKHIHQYDFAFIKA